MDAFEIHYNMGQFYKVRHIIVIRRVNENAETLLSSSTCHIIKDPFFIE